MPINSAVIILMLLGLIFVFGLLTVLFQPLVRSRRGLALRSIPAYQALPKLQGRTIEAGQSLHISVGTSGIGGLDTAATLAGLTVLEAISEEAIANDAPPLITVADPTALILAQDVLRRSYIRQNNLSGYEPRSVHYVAATPMPYAAAVMGLLGPRQTSANVMVGAFGAESAMILEEGARRGVSQVVSTSDASSLALLYPSSDHLLIGEEMFVPGAYMGTKPAHLSSAIVQDVFRWLVVAGIIVAFILSPLLR